jgi:hypothetical protein
VCILRVEATEGELAELTFPTIGRFSQQRALQEMCKSRNREIKQEISINLVSDFSRQLEKLEFGVVVCRVRGHDHVVNYVVEYSGYLYVNNERYKMHSRRGGEFAYKGLAAEKCHIPEFLATI